MPLPYRKTPRAAQEGCAAYLDVVWLRPARAFYGALLLTDGRGQPLEFLHNSLTAPSGFLWPDDLVMARAVAALAHSLFDACRSEPDLLLCLDALGSPEFCRTELTPSIPFARIVPATEDAPAEWGWVNEPPAPGMRAQALYQELTRRGFVEEPFQRLRQGLREVYPDAPWPEAEDNEQAERPRANDSPSE
jgi:hypothetical protein